jgi:hypothetical protein
MPSPPSLAGAKASEAEKWQKDRLVFCGFLNVIDDNDANLSLLRH